MKRFLCTVLVIAMLVSMLPVIAMAGSTPNYEDYIKVEMDDNIFNYANNKINNQYHVETDSSVAKRTLSYANDYQSWNVVKAYDALTIGSKVKFYYLPGGQITSLKILKEDAQYDQSYVISFNARNNTDYNAKVNAAFLEWKVPGSNLQYTKEYQSGGLELTGTDWHEFKGTIKVAAATSGPANNPPWLQLGFSLDCLNGAGADFRYSDLYLAKERAYDIANNLVDGKTTVKTGDVLTFEAELINQIGLPGYLDQTIKWMAMDTERENEVSGISIETSEDTKTATVTIEDTLLPGSYDIVAYSEEYDMAKGCTITMEAPYYYKDSGSLVTKAKLNTSDEWTSDKVSTGLVNHIEVKATLEGNTEAFEWLVTNKNRLSIVEDVFDVIPITTSGAEQTVKVVAKTGVDVKPGDYNVVAIAKDGSLKAHPINLDITGDLAIILNTFVNGTTEEIEEGLKTTYLSVLGLLDSNSSKADKTALAKVISGAAEEEKIADITEVEDIREVLERLAVLSFYNVKPEGVELTDQNDNFTFEKELGIDKIDTEGVTLYALYKTAMTEVGQANVLSSVTGKDIKTVSEFVSQLKERIVINAIAYPVSNGSGFVSDVLTEKNMLAVSLDAGNYLASDDKSSYNSAIAGKTLTLEQIEEELKKEYKQEGSGSSSDTGNSGNSGSSGRGPSSTVITVPSEKAENDEEVKPEVKFDDVSESHWAYTHIVFLNKTNVINGLGDGNFHPGKTVTREQALKMICEAFDIETSNADCTFADVDKNAWYYDYVASAKQSGIVNGITDTEFGIGKPVTRQDICVMIMRALSLEDGNYPENSFADAQSIAPYAKDAVNYLSALFVVNGFTDGSFRPQNNCTRAEMAKIIYNCIHIFDEI